MSNNKGMIWAGRIITVLAALFFLMDAVMKFIKPPIVVESTLKLGYPESTIVGIGAALLVSTVLYIIPRTAILGAILLTAYLGGAVATHVRVNEGIFPVIFAVIFGVLVWLALYLRDEQLRALVPFRS